MERLYCFCRPTDGLLYAEVPSFTHLVTLLLNQRWRGVPHLRTVNGYTPYHACGIAFRFEHLRLKGVQPTWYLKDETQAQHAIQQLVEDGVFEDDWAADEARGQWQYRNECEWTGPARMRFSLRDVEFVWVGRKTTDQELRLLREVLPEWLTVKADPPPTGGSPCR